MRIQLFGSLMAALGLSWGASAQSSFIIEAEDFDFGGGQHMPEADVMPYFGGAYQSISAVHQVDYYKGLEDWNSDYYREGEEPNVPIAFGTGSNAESRDRGEWFVNVNYRFAWNYSDSWYNYTRVFPEGDYRIYGGITFGALTPGIKAKLELVTSGFGTTEQSVIKLGDFDGIGSGRWDFPTRVQLKNGNDTVILRLSGETTLRFTPEVGEFDYLLFVPAHAPEPSISAQKNLVTAGQPLKLTATMLGEGPFSYQWRLNGEDIPGANDSVYEVLEATSEDRGNYSVLVSNAHGSMSSATVAIQVAYGINIGDTVAPGFPAPEAGTFNGGFEQHYYMFSASKGDAVYLEGLDGDDCTGLALMLFAPSGQRLLHSYLGTCGWGQMEPHYGLVLPEDGEYSIAVLSQGVWDNPNYSFNLRELSAGTTQTISFGETVEVTSFDPTTMDVYQFESGSAGAIYVEEVSEAGCWGGRSWSLYDSEGTLLKTAPLGRGCTFTFGEPKGTVLPNPGTYTLVVTHGSVVYDPYILRVWGTSLQTHPISIGASITPSAVSGAGILDAPAAADIYEFNGEAGQKIYFYGRVLSSDANVEFFLRGTAGGVGVAGTFGSAEYPQNYRLYTLPYTGTYRIVVLSSTDSLGEYAFDLLPSVGVQSFEYTLGQTIDITALPAGYLDSNGAVDEFTFTIPEPGQLLTFADLGSEDAKITWTLQEVAPWMTWPVFIDPLDGIVFEEGIFFYPAGTYKITVAAQDGDPSSEGWYSFKTIVHNYPVAVGDSNFKTKRGKSVRIPKGKLMSNDYDPDGEEVSWLDLSFTPSQLNGSLADEGDTLLYTPNVGFVGKAEFSYRIQDPYALRSAPAAVRIVVE